MNRFLSFVSLGALAAFAGGVAAAKDITVSGDWILLGDVAPVQGAPAKKPIAAAPLPGQRLPLAAAFIEMQAQAAGFPVDLEDGTTIWVTRSAKTVDIAPQKLLQKAPVKPKTVDGKIPVLTTGLRRGDAITPDLITFVEPDPDRRIQGLIQSTELLQDTEAARNLRAGQPLALRDIQAISVIKKGDAVKLVFEQGMLRLTVNAKALSDAAKGETVRVMNLQSKRTMDAIAMAPGTASFDSAGL